MPTHTLSSRDPLLRHPPPLQRLLPRFSSSSLSAFVVYTRGRENDAVRDEHPRMDPSPSDRVDGGGSEREYRAGEKVSGITGFLPRGVVSLIGYVYSVLVRSLASCRD